MKLGKTVNGLDKIMKSVLGQHLFKYIFIACTVILYVPVHPGKLSTFIICIYSQALLRLLVYKPYGLLYVIKNAELLPGRVNRYRVYNRQDNFYPCI